MERGGRRLWGRRGSLSCDVSGLCQKKEREKERKMDEKV